jgi:hypothetical protein
MMPALPRLSGLVLVAANVAAPLQPVRLPIPFRIVAEGLESRIEIRRELIIRGMGVWDFVWRKHATTTPPEIDFRRETIIAIFAGKQPSPAKAVRVICVSEEDGSIVVRYEEDTVQQTTQASSVSSSPFVMIAIPPQQPPVKFVRVERSIGAHVDPDAAVRDEARALVRPMRRRNDRARERGSWRRG